MKDTAAHHLKTGQQAWRPAMRYLTLRATNGQGGIRTHDTREGIPVFETGSFSHSDTCPQLRGKIRRERERKSVLTAYRLTVSPPLLRDLARSTMLINSCR